MRRNRDPSPTSYFCGEWYRVNGECVSCSGVNAGLHVPVLLDCWAYMLFVQLRANGAHHLWIVLELPRHHRTALLYATGLPQSLTV
jgi:hypothetical protein